MSTLDQHYIDEGEMTNVNKQADIVWKKVNNFISYLDKRIKISKAKKTNTTNKTNSTS